MSFMQKSSRLRIFFCFFFSVIIQQMKRNELEHSDREKMNMLAS